MNDLTPALQVAAKAAYDSMEKSSGGQLEYDQLPGFFKKVSTGGGGQDKRRRGVVKKSKGGCCAEQGAGKGGDE